MSKIIEMTGRRFGRLVVERKGPSAGRGEAQWHCRCDCGAETLVRGHCLRRGDTKSCGCLAREKRAERKCQKCSAFRELSEYQGKRGRVCLACRQGPSAPRRTEKGPRSVPEQGADSLALRMARVRW